MEFRNTRGAVSCLLALALALSACGDRSGASLSEPPGLRPQSAAVTPSTRAYANGLYVETGAASVPAQVYRLYRAAFGREADPQGLGFHVNAIEVAGVSLQQVAANFVASPEFATRYGNVDASGFIVLLYDNVLGRQPDLDGFNFWMNALATGHSRAEVLIGFSESDENKKRTAAAVAAGLTFEPYPFTRVYLTDGTYLESNPAGTAAAVYRLYQAAFNRVPDAQGLGFHIGSVEKLGVSMLQVAQNFIASAEFTQLYGQQPTDTAFVTQLYQNVLHRAPDADGLKFWTDALAAGHSRAEVLLGFSNSDENKANTLTAVTNGMHFVPYPSKPAEPPVDPFAPLQQLGVDQSIALWGVQPEGQGGDNGGDGGAGGGAGDGAPLKGATVVLVDSQGHTVSGKTDGNGNYFLRFNTSVFTPPFLVKVTDAAGNVLASTSNETVGSGFATRINVNPLTDKITSDALTSTVRGTIEAESGAHVTASALPQAKIDLRTSVATALVTAGVSDPANFDAVRSIYAQNGTGVDAVVESVTHSRDPVSGATQLHPKVGGTIVNDDGTVTTVNITAATPLLAQQVVAPSDPTLTFAKLDAWMKAMNTCLAASNTPGALGCSGAAQNALVSASYRHDSAPFRQDFASSCGQMLVTCDAKSQLRNPSVVFLGRYPGSNTDDMAVVEMTIQQPLAPGETSPREIARQFFFKRDDAAQGWTAGNWILMGNQSPFNWHFDTMYQELRNVTSNGQTWFGYESTTLNFFVASQAFDMAGTPQDANMYALRLKGPGLPAAGLVFAPTGGPFLGLLNKTGAIPSPGTTASNTSGFILGAVNLDTLLPVEAWFSPSNAWTADSGTSTDFSKMLAFSRYTAEVFLTTQAQPVIDYRYLPAAVLSPAKAARRTRNDFSPSLAAILPPQPAQSTITAQWVRKAGAPTITDVYFAQRTGGEPAQHDAYFPLPDAFVANATSTSATVPVSGFVALTGDPGDHRLVSFNGRADHGYYQTVYSFDNWGSGVTTIAGPLSVQVDGITAAPDGTIYFTSSAAHSVYARKPDGSIYQIGGNGTAGSTNGIGTNAKFNAPQGIVVNPVTGDLYVAEVGGNRIRKAVISGTLPSATVSWSTYAGSGADGFADGTGTAATFGNPNSVAIDGSGNLYVTSSGRCTCVRKITTGRVVTTTNYLSMTQGLTQVAVNASGQLYFATTVGELLRPNASNPSTFDTVKPDAAFPNGGWGLPIALDASGTLYASDWSAGKLLKWVPGQASPVAIAGTGLDSSPQDGSDSAKFVNPAAIATVNGAVYVGDSFWIRQVVP